MPHYTACPLYHYQENKVTTFYDQLCAQGPSFLGAVAIIVGIDEPGPSFNNACRDLAPLEGDLTVGRAADHYLRGRLAELRRGVRPETTLESALEALRREGYTAAAVSGGRIAVQDPSIVTWGGGRRVEYDLVHIQPAQVWRFLADRSAP